MLCELTSICIFPIHRRDERAIRGTGTGSGIITDIYCSILWRQNHRKLPNTSVQSVKNAK